MKADQTILFFKPATQVQDKPHQHRWRFQLVRHETWTITGHLVYLDKIADTVYFEAYLMNNL